METPAPLPSNVATSPSNLPAPVAGPGADRDPALHATLLDALAHKGAGYLPRTRHLHDVRHPRFVNRLIRESSPYLLQHAHNPVDWYPWGNEAFEDARRLGRPVFLSIGYSTCHWCHVMEEESFEDEGIAAELNQNFIAIKVDREERPDIDAIYMSAVQALTGAGGWPMSVFLTPDREPFFGGTYFPPRDGARGARMGFSTLLTQLAQTYAQDRARVDRASASLVAAIREQMEGAEASAREKAQAAGIPVPDRRPIDNALTTYGRLFDNVHGGLRRAPKFPSNIPVRLLLRAYRRSGDADLLRMCTLTLEKMAAGGMYDQIGGGFHRYSTDAEWLVPHFEKMLYDNALLVPAYAEAHQITGRPDFARVVRETLDYLLREMTAQTGGFFSATDADSKPPTSNADGSGDAGKAEEGLFFVWSRAEIVSLLGPEADRFCRYYGITEGGNFEGQNIPHVAKPDDAEHAALADARRKLYEARAKRPLPLLDDKILAAWNGLAISAMAFGGRVLGQERYLAAARAAADFVLTKMRRGDRIVRSWKDGVAKDVGFLEDQAFVVQGLIDLWEATFEARWLEEAIAIATAQEASFADAEHGGWFMSPRDGEALIAREKPQYDGAEPSGTSVAWRNALRLAALTGEASWETVAARAFASVAAVLNNNPLALSEGLLALDWMTDVAREIVIVVPEKAGMTVARPLLDEAERAFVPSRVLVVVRENQAPPALRALTADRPAVAGKATAYVCVQGRCELPVTEPEELRRLLTTNSPAAAPA
ncbi:MAG TPA: thioredoxin domain-containing protein [Polyangia bacterium]